MSFSVTLYRRGGLVSTPDDVQDYAAGVGRNAVYAPQSGARIPEGETPPVIDASGTIIAPATPYGEKNQSFLGAITEGVGALILSLAGGAAYATATAPEASFAFPDEGGASISSVDSSYAFPDEGGASIDATNVSPLSQFTNIPSGVTQIAETPAPISAPSQATAFPDEGGASIDATNVSPVAQFSSVPNVVQPASNQMGILDTAFPEEGGPSIPSVDSSYAFPEEGGASIPVPDALNGANTAVTLTGLDKVLDTVKKVIGVTGTAKSVLSNVASNGQRSDVAPLAGTWSAPGAARSQTSAPAANAGASWILPAIAGFVFLIALIFFARR